MQKLSTGINGLDSVLGGGLPRNRIYLLSGNPGTGKTTMALQFLLEGVRLNEPVIYVTLSETKDELKAVAESHNWSLDKIDICDLTISEDSLNPKDHYTIFHPSEVELDETTKMVLDEVERIKPLRVVFDSLSEVRLLARDPLRYRRQILALKQFFIGRQCTVLLLDDHTSLDSDRQLESLAHGVISLENLSPEYGRQRHRISISKLRGVKFHSGYHDFNIETGGIVIFPRLIPGQNKIEPLSQPFVTGLPEFDNLLGGGISYGSSTLILGPAGVGKSSLAALYGYIAAEKGENAAFFLFDEGINSFFTRTSQLGIDIARHYQSGRIDVRQIDPAELSPGEFSNLVCQSVQKSQARVVVIDSLNGYLNAMPNERFLTIQMHELLSYLNHHGVVTILVMAQHGMLGDMRSEVDLSYLSDNIVLMRYFEAKGAVLQAISVIKKRIGKHERIIREFQITDNGLKIGAPLKDFHGVLTGVPTFTGDTKALMVEKEKDNASND